MVLGKHVGPDLTEQVNALLFPVVSHVHVTSASFVSKVTAQANVITSLFVAVADTVAPLSKLGTPLFGSQVFDKNITSVIWNGCYFSGQVIVMWRNS